MSTMSETAACAPMKKSGTGAVLRPPLLRYDRKAFPARKSASLGSENPGIGLRLLRGPPDQNAMSFPMLMLTLSATSLTIRA
jgi:hypothetical protein